MAEQDDRAWFDTLAGRESAGANPGTVKEAEAVRRAALAATLDQEAQDLNIESGAQQLLFRLRREGLDHAAAKKQSWQTWGAFSIAATLLLAVGVVMLQAPTVEDMLMYRGAGAQTLTTPDTAKLAATLTAELDALGIQAKITRFGATHTITANWPAKPDAKHAAFLKRHGLQQPASGMLTIEILRGNTKFQ